MERTTVYLTEAQKRALARAAKASGRSEAELIREGVDVVTNRVRAAEPALSPFVLAVLDYLLVTRISVVAELAFVDQVAGGAYRLEPMDPSDVSRAVEVIAQYRDLELGLADASIVVLAERYGTVEVLTLDQRHFRAVDGPRGKPFRILPADG